MFFYPRISKPRIIIAVVVFIVPLAVLLAGCGDRLQATDPETTSLSSSTPSLGAGVWVRGPWRVHGHLLEPVSRFR